MKYIYLSFLIYIFFSCKKENGSTEIVLKDNIFQLINEYITEHPQFNTFILQNSLGIPDVENSLIEQGYLLGPGYEKILQENDLSIYFESLSKRIYYISDINPLFKIDKKKVNEWMNTTLKDSIRLDTLENSYPIDWIIKDEETLFIYHAIFFKLDKEGNIEINNRPDTIFLPKFQGTINFGE